MMVASGRPRGRPSDVVVIGAGIAGATAAYELARRGVSVRLVDKAAPGSGQSGRNWGFVRRQGCDPIEVDLVEAASKRWSALGDEIGAPLTLVQRGLLNVASDPERLSQYTSWLHATGAAARFGSRMVSGDEVRELVPALEGSWAGGLYTPGDGHADPAAATEAIAAAAEREGAMLDIGTTVHGIAVEAGRVSGIRSSDGIQPADMVVVAAGAWSSQLLRSVGLDLPIRWVRATAARTTPGAPATTDLAVGTPGVGFSQRADGSIVFGTAAWSDYDLSFESLRHLPLFLPNFVRNWRMFRLHLNGFLFEDLLRRVPGTRLRRNVYAWRRIADPPPNEGKIRDAHEKLRRIVPRLADTTIARIWAGIVDVTPDALPVIGRAPGVEGLVLASGLSSHGFGIGPGVGEAAAQLIVDGKATIDLAPFRFERFREHGGIRSHQHL